MELQRRIVAYLATHPDALDTLDGIARWWVESDRYAVAPALTGLERRGVVQRRELGGAIYYALHDNYRGRAADDIIAAAIRDGNDGWKPRPRRR